MTLIDLQGKALYSGDKEVKKAYFGGNVFYSLGPSIEPGKFQIPGMYGANTLASSSISSSLYGYTLSNEFISFHRVWFPLGGATPNQYFYSYLRADMVTTRGGSTKLGMKIGSPFKAYTPSAAGNYVLKYDARTSPGQTNAGYFSKTSSTTDDIGSFQTYTTEWASYYEPPINVINTAAGYTFYLRLQREPGDLGSVQFANFEFIPADLL